MEEYQDGFMFKWELNDHNMFRTCEIEIANKIYTLNDFHIEEVLVEGDYIYLLLTWPLDRDDANYESDIIIRSNRNLEYERSNLNELIADFNEDREEAWSKANADQH